MNISVNYPEGVMEEREGGREGEMEGGRKKGGKKRRKKESPEPRDIKLCL